MAVGIIRNLGGGSKKNTKLYLYKNGYDNTDITGNIAQNDYKGWAGFNYKAATFSKDSDCIVITPTGNEFAYNFGSALMIDVTNYSRCVVIYSFDNQEKTAIEVNVSSLNQYRYVGIGYCYGDGGQIQLSCGSEKQTEKQPTTLYTNLGKHTLKVYEIYLELINV